MADARKQIETPPIEIVDFEPTLQERFLNWYRPRFSGLIRLKKPLNYLTQFLVWYFGIGFIWIPIWFLCTDESTSKTGERSLRDQIMDAIQRVEWGKVGALVLQALAFVATAFVFAIAAIGVAMSAVDGTCRHCGQPKRPGFPVCPHCGWSR